MKYPKIRIERLTISNMKSVRSGSVDFSAANALRAGKASVLGIYGQNGSGKTVVIEAIAMIKSILSGQQISRRHLESITQGEINSHLEIEMSVFDSVGIDCSVIYKCVLEQRDNPNISNLRNGAIINSKEKTFIAVISESLKIAGSINGIKYPQQYIAETDETQELVRPEQKRKLLFGNNDETLISLERHKLLALYGSRSFIFSDQAADVIKDNCNHDFGSIINSIRFFAIARLFIVGGETQCEVPLPFNFVLETENHSYAGHLPFSLESKALLHKEALSIFESLIHPMNLVLSSIVPGLKVTYRAQKASLDEKDSAYEVELFSSRDGLYEFPLSHESLGIKKIISFLSLLIATFNDASHVLAVDEIDSSVFEFLLGEVMGIMKDHGKGQLIFTSHNLRPLEKLDDSSICFTTIDPDNRYIKLKKKTTNNLRDMYFRIISLGNDDIELYNSESKNALAFAFRQAGYED